MEWLFQARELWLGEIKPASLSLGIVLTRSRIGMGIFFTKRSILLP